MNEKELKKELHETKHDLAKAILEESEQPNDQL